MKHLTISLLFLLASPCFANMEFDGSISMGTNDNISNAVSDLDIFDDTFISANFNAGKRWVPNPGKTFLLRGHLGTQQFDVSNGLDQFSYGGSLTYIQRLGLGAYVPRISLSLKGNYRDFETDMRDGWLWRTSLGIEKRFTPALHGSLGITYEKRNADANKAKTYIWPIPGDVFNQRNNEFMASLDYTLVNNSVITARYVYRDGEIDASTNPGSAFFQFAKAVAVDHEICDTCQYAAYLVDATAHSLMLDWNIALGKDSSVSLNMERRVAETTGNNIYGVSIFRVQMNRRF